MAEATGNGETNEDPSMEEILQSIRRIIAEDDSDVRKPREEEAKKPLTREENMSPKDTKNAPADEAEEEENDQVNDSDVLELTEMVEDDGSVVDVSEESGDSAPVDVMENIDSALGDDKPGYEGEPLDLSVKPEEREAFEEVILPGEEKVARGHDDVISADKAEEEDDDDSSLISEEAAAASTAALKKISKNRRKTDVPLEPSMPFRSGATVEDLVQEMLRPMLKEWLDGNLPTLVERIVEKEVRKLSRDDD